MHTIQTKLIKLTPTPSSHKLHSDTEFMNTYIGEYCKFTTYSKFNHSKPKYVIENSDKIDKLEKKVKALESLKPKEKAVNDNLAKEMDIKIETFEEKMKTFLEIIKEKDDVIKAWETKFQQIEHQISQKLTKIDKN